MFLQYVLCSNDRAYDVVLLSYLSHAIQRREAGLNSEAIYGLTGIFMNLIFVLMLALDNGQSLACITRKRKWVKWVLVVYDQQYSAILESTE